MKHATLNIAIVFLLSGPLAVLAETPAVPVNPLDTGAAQAAVESAVQPVIEALPTAATAADTSMVEAQSNPADAAAAAVDVSAVKAAAPAAADVVELDVIPLEAATAAPAAADVVELDVVPLEAATAAPAAADVVELDVVPLEAATAAPAAVDVVELDVVPLEAATAAPAAGTTAAGDSANPCPMYGMGKYRAGMGADGSDMRGMKQCAGCKGKGKRMEMGKRHAEVVQRLDMIEARMAKIEAMLESLMKRTSN